MQENTGSRKTAEQPEILEALATIAKAVLGEELKALRDSVSALQNSMHQRIDTLVRDQASSSEALRKEVSEKLEKLGQSLASAEKSSADSLAEMQGKLLKTGGDLERKLTANAAELDKKLAQSAEAIKTETVVMHDSIKTEQADFQQQAIQQFQYVEGRLGSGAQELASLQKDHARLSSVLANFGRAFTGGAPEATVPAEQPAAQEPPSATIPTVTHPLPKAAAANSALPGSDDIEQGFDELFRSK